MNRDNIIRMAREAEGQGLAQRDFIDIERFATLVAAHEREEIVEAVDQMLGCEAYEIADAIRALKGENNEST